MSVSLRVMQNVSSVQRTTAKRSPVREVAVSRTLTTERAERCTQTVRAMATAGSEAAQNLVLLRLGQPAQQFVDIDWLGEDQVGTELGGFLEERPFFPADNGNSNG